MLYQAHTKCIDCPDRYPGCSDKCEDYQRIKQYNKEKKKQYLTEKKRFIKSETMAIEGYKRRHRKK